MIRKQLLGLVLCLGYMLLPAAAETSTSSVFEGNTITETDPIDLQGDLAKGHYRIPDNTKAVSAFLQDGAILVIFHRNVGVVSVIITDDSGNIAYSGTADSAAGQAVIPVSDLPPGTCTLTLGNAAGTMRGEFEMN